MMRSVDAHSNRLRRILLRRSHNHHHRFSLASLTRTRTLDIDWKNVCHVGDGTIEQRQPTCGDGQRGNVLNNIPQYADSRARLDVSRCVCAFVLLCVGIILPDNISILLSQSKWFVDDDPDATGVYVVHPKITNDCAVCVLPIVQCLCGRAACWVHPDVDAVMHEIW